VTRSGARDALIIHRRPGTEIFLASLRPLAGCSEPTGKTNSATDVNWRKAVELVEVVVLVVLVVLISFQLILELLFIDS